MPMYTYYNVHMVVYGLVLHVRVEPVGMYLRARLKTTLYIL